MAPSDEILIDARGVGKKFCRTLRRSLWYGICDTAADLTLREGRRGELRKGEFWANENIDFQVRRGECVGLIGHNGSGKTTLLKVINGLLKPDAGEVRVRGRVGALIALGAGFNPVLTGRENVFVAGSVLGIKRAEIAAKFDEIVEFSELEQFIDSPVQNYSSGMQVRLGFAVATALNPDVVLIDEVLAVGDAAFRAKCYRRLSEMLDDAAVVIVSHHLDHISRMCDRALVLDHGHVAHEGDVGDAVETYNGLLFHGSGSGPDPDGFVEMIPPVSSASVTFGSLDATWGQPVTGHLDVVLDEAMPNASLRFSFFDRTRRLIGECGTEANDARFDLAAGSNRVEFSFTPQLRPGAYPLSVSLTDNRGVAMRFWSHLQHRLNVSGHPRGYGSYQMKLDDFRVSSADKS